MADSSDALPTLEIRLGGMWRISALSIQGAGSVCDCYIEEFYLAVDYNTHMFSFRTISDVAVGDTSPSQIPGNANRHETVRIELDPHIVVS